MNEVIAVIAAAGAWLLFTGPLLQAALELRNDTPRGPDHADRPLLQGSVVAGWWWVFPPVALWLHYRARRVARQKRLQAMRAGEIRTALEFSNKALGWLLVSSGALCIAVKETWEAGETWHAPAGLRWAVMGGATIVAFVVIGLIMIREGKLLTAGAATGGRRGAERLR